MPDPGRLEVLERLASERPDDPFVRYGLALERRSLGRHEEALATFRSIHERFPDYLPAWHQHGLLLSSLGRAAEAREALGRGLAVARAQGNAHAAGEIEGALADLGEG